MKIKKLASIILTATLVVSTLLTACGNEKDKTTEGKQNTAKEEKLKVALILTGAKSDGSWNGGAYEGIQWLENNRDNIETTYVENISADDAGTVIQNYVDEGYNFIIGFGQEYTDAINEIAKANPTIYFADTNTSSTDRPENVAILNGNQGEAAYLVGVIAASLSKTGKIGTVEAFESANQSENTVNYIAGAKYVKKDIEVVDSFIGSWTDVEKAKQTTVAEIESGVDFIYGSGDQIGLGIIKGAAENKVPVVGYGGTTDLKETAPEYVATTVLWNAGKTFGNIVDDIRGGKFKTKIYYATLGDEAITLAPYNELVTEDIQKKVEEVREKIKNGEITISR